MAFDTPQFWTVLLGLVTALVAILSYVRAQNSANRQEWKSDIAEADKATRDAIAAAEAKLEQRIRSVEDKLGERIQAAESKLEQCM